MQNVVFIQQEAGCLRENAPIQTVDCVMGLSKSRKSLKIQFNTQGTQCVIVLNLLLALLYWPRFQNCGGGSLRDIFQLLAHRGEI